jgi:hypothetical protein
MRSLKVSITDIQGDPKVYINMSTLTTRSSCDVSVRTSQVDANAGQASADAVGRADKVEGKEEVFAKRGHYHLV